MVRFMKPGASNVDLIPVGAVPALARGALLPGLLAGLCLALVAGCASPPPAASSANGSMRPGGERSVPVARPDRDGAPRPSETPPELALLPDPVPQVEPIKPGGPNKPYVVLGQSYEPKAADISWKERGTASWYGTKFHGRRTASGELFSMYGLTAAHRTLPIPSYARVRHLSTGKEIIVRVNDRGPFHSARVLDLSYAAAAKLGFVGQGSAQVEIERLTFDEIRSGAWRRGTLMDDAAPEQVAGEAVAPLVGASADPILALAEGSPSQGGSPQALVADEAERARAHTPFAKGFWVQLAALGKRDGVDRLQQRIATELAALQPLLAVFHEGPHFKLQVGPYASRDQALAAAQQARDALQLRPMLVERR